MCIRDRVWLNVLGSAGSQGPDCPPPPPVAGAPPSGDVLDRTALDEVPPAPPQLARVQVLNGNGQRGEAAIVAAGLADLGFRPTAEPANDPLHPTFELTCHGQIRFGAGGVAAARAAPRPAPSDPAPPRPAAHRPRVGTAGNPVAGTGWTRAR